MSFNRDNTVDTFRVKNTVSANGRFKKKLAWKSSFFQVLLSLSG